MARTKPENEVWAGLANATSTAPRAAEDIASRIRQLIIDQDLADGERLPSERDLAAILQTSRPTVSQAIRILVVQGLVESRHGSGAYVRRRSGAVLATSVDLLLSLNQESLRHLGDLRLWLETTGVVQAIKHASDAELDHAQRALDDLVANAGEAAAWMSADNLFHATLVRASGNPYLASIYESVHTALINYEYRSWIETGTVPAWLGLDQADTIESLHGPILQAVRDRDPDLAIAAVLLHHEAMSAHLAAS